MPAKEEGRFRLPGVLAGTYEIWVRAGNGGFNLPRLEVGEAAETIRRDVDVLRHRWVE